MLLEVVPELLPHDSEARFLFEERVHTDVASVIEGIVEVYNLRRQLAKALDRAAAKPYSTDSTGSSTAHVGSKRSFNHLLGSCATGPEADVDTRFTPDHAVATATALLSDESVRRKRVCTREQLRAAMQALECAPPYDAPEACAASGGSGDWATLQLNATSEKHGPGEGLVNLHVDRAYLFFAGRVLDGDKPLSQYVGTNEKCKVLVRLRCEARASTDGEAATDGDLRTACVPAATIGGSASDAVSSIGNRPAVDSDAHGAAGTAHMADFNAGGVGEAQFNSAESAEAAVNADGAAGSAAAGGAAAKGMAMGSVAGAGAAATAADAPVVSLSSYFRGSGADVAEAQRGESGEAQDEDETALTESQARTLRASALVRLVMRNKRLSQMVRAIDGSETRELALRRLERALLDEEFSQFTQELLAEIVNCE
mmetsp:Transcript_25303/g.52908  ORF Transcript_25303/g.52908 Transcript_25303/m.52908 type:complete len:428 (+) Transcript_25303:145-1428(+)